MHLRKRIRNAKGMAGRASERGIKRRIKMKDNSRKKRRQSDHQISEIQVSEGENKVSER